MMTMINMNATPPRNHRQSKSVGASAMKQAYDRRTAAQTGPSAVAVLVGGEDRVGLA
jgi:hypothetical protein